MRFAFTRQADKHLRPSAPRGKLEAVVILSRPGVGRVQRLQFLRSQAFRIFYATLENRPDDPSFRSYHGRNGVGRGG